MTGKDTNSRTTVAVLGTKMDHLTDTVEDAVKEMKDQATRTAEVEKCIAVLSVEYQNLDEKVDDLADQNKKYNIGTALGAGFAAVLATVLGILGMRN